MEVVESGSEGPIRVVPMPLGTHEARVDEKGRLKIPAKVLPYLQAAGKRLFVTTLDLVTARLYPVSVWEQNLSLFKGAQDDPEAASDMWLVAQHYGDETELDGQSRILIHPELRRSLGMENQPVWLECYNGRINIYSKATYEARLETAKAKARENLLKLERRGLV